MKKLLLMSLCLIMTFSLVACSAKAKNIEEYINNPVMVKQLESQMPEGVKISAEGDNLIYTINTGTEKKDGDAEALKKELQKQEKDFKKAGQDIKKEAGVSQLTIIYKYIDSKGQEITTYEIPID